MCVTFFLFRELDEFPLLLAFNRDEAFERSTEVAHWWPDKPHILGGRDQLAGGTWLCLCENGRVAWLTNYWEKGCCTPRTEGPSRGELPVNFVEGSAEPLEYLANVEGHRYPGFNLLVADLRNWQAAYLCNRDADPRPEPVAPGLHGITNGRMDASWAKVEEGKRALQRLIDSGAFEGGEMPWEEIFRVMSDDRVLITDPAELPSSCAHAKGLDAAAKSIFVQPTQTPMGTSGTRSQIVVAVRRDGICELRERYRSPEGDWREVAHQFRVPLAQEQAGGWGQRQAAAGSKERKEGGPVLEASECHASRALAEPTGCRAPG